MPHGEHFGPVRPFRAFPRINPEPFDTRQNIFVPDRSIDTAKIRNISVRKIQMIGAKVYNSGTQAIVDDGAYHNVTFDTASFDQGDLWDASNPTRLTIPYSGIWSLSTFVSIQASAAGVRRYKLNNNGAVILQYIEQTPSPTGVLDTDMPVLTSDYRLTAGDIITTQVRQNTGGNLNVQAGEANNFLLAVFRGPV